MQTDRTIPNRHISSSAGLWNRVGQMLRFTARPTREPVLIKVWDARREQYRHVDLLDRDDPLWYAAKNLAAMQGTFSSRSAA